MARITVEDCIDKFDSRFELVLVASNRARKLYSGEEPTVERDNDKNTVIALREIADETISAEVFKEDLVEEYQSVSPIDEEELALEFNEENSDDEADSEKLSNVSDEAVETETTEVGTEDSSETNNEKESDNITEFEADQSN